MLLFPAEEQRRLGNTFDIGTRWSRYIQDSLRLYCGLDKAEPRVCANSLRKWRTWRIKTNISNAGASSANVQFDSTRHAHWNGIRQPLAMCKSTVSGHAPSFHSHAIVTCTAIGNCSAKNEVDMGTAIKSTFRDAAALPSTTSAVIPSTFVCSLSYVVHLSTFFCEDETTCVCSHHAYCSMQNPLPFVSLFADFRFPALEGGWLLWTPNALQTADPRLVICHIEAQLSAALTRR
jgi:hypothetical protein